MISSKSLFSWTLQAFYARRTQCKNKHKSAESTTQVKTRVKINSQALSHHLPLVRRSNQR